MSRVFKISLLLAVLALPGTALATHIEDCRLSADCSGWELAVDIDWRSAPVMVSSAHLVFSIVLTDENGGETARYDFDDMVDRMSDPETKTFNGLWGMELCGTYTVTKDVMLSTDYAGDVTTYCAGSVTFTCDCPTDACNFTPGYWKNHPENWPVLTLTLGCADPFDQTALLAILGTPVRGDATIILAYHLIAAKLNVANGSDPSIGGAIEEADALLCSYPLRSNPKGDARDMILDVKNLLAGYNELGCDRGGYSKEQPDEASSSWGELKASYR